MAHEIGHVISRLKNVIKTGKAPDLERESGARGTAISHAEEDYADLLAIKIVDATGEYSMKGITRFFETLAAEDKSAMDELAGMMSHPAHRMRFRDQTRHVLDGPYRNKNKEESALDEEFSGSLRDFPGTFSSLPPLARDVGTAHNLQREAQRLQNRVSGTSTYNLQTLREQRQEAQLGCCGITPGTGNHLGIFDRIPVETEHWEVTSPRLTFDLLPEDFQHKVSWLDLSPFETFRSS